MDVVRLTDETATQALGRSLAEAFAGASGGVVFLDGDLGAGKTSLARAWLRAWGARGAVRSPTYSLLEPYELDGRRVLHMDLYRLQDATELQQLGLDDLAPDEVLWLVEWPQRGAGVLPSPTLQITLRPQDIGRLATLRWAAEQPAQTLRQAWLSRLEPILQVEP